MQGEVNTVAAYPPQHRDIRSGHSPQGPTGGIQGIRCEIGGNTEQVRDLVLGHDGVEFEKDGVIPVVRREVIDSDEKAGSVAG